MQRNKQKSKQQVKDTTKLNNAITRQTGRLEQKDPNNKVLEGVPRVFCPIPICDALEAPTPAQLREMITYIESKGYSWKIYLAHEDVQSNSLQDWYVGNVNISRDQTVLLVELRKQDAWLDIKNKYKAFCASDKHRKSASEALQGDVGKCKERLEKKLGRKDIPIIDVEEHIIDDVVDILYFEWYWLQQMSECTSRFPVTAFFYRNDHTRSQGYAMQNSAAILGHGECESLLYHVKHEFEDVPALVEKQLVAKKRLSPPSPPSSASSSSTSSSGSSPPREMTIRGKVRKDISSGMTEGLGNSGYSVGDIAFANFLFFKLACEKEEQQYIHDMNDDDEEQEQYINTNNNSITQPINIKPTRFSNANASFFPNPPNPKMVNDSEPNDLIITRDAAQEAQHEHEHNSRIGIIAGGR